jgi:GNAT superfamily N-acetyltransferase
MHELIAESYPLLPSFFSREIPNSPMLYAFLEGKAPGRAYVETLSGPEGCIVSMDYSFVFLGGKVSDQFLYQTIHQLRKENLIHLIWQQKFLSFHQPPAGYSHKIKRREFFKRNPPSNSDSEKAKLPLGFSIARISPALLPQCIWADDIIHVFGSVSGFLTNGLGFCILHSGKIVAEAYASFWGANRIEVAVVTAPEFRRRGLAFFVSNHLIETCETLGFETYWSCDANNTASINLAKQHGYLKEKKYTLFHYPCLDPKRETITERIETSLYSGLFSPLKRPSGATKASA